MILKFDFQRDEVSFFFLLSHPTALPCITGVDQFRHIGAFHQGTENAELGGLFLGHHIAEGVGQDGKVLIPPLLVAVIVDGRICQPHQMPDAPGNEPAAALKIAIGPGCDTQSRRDTLCYTRFFTAYKFHSLTPVLSSELLLVRGRGIIKKICLGVSQMTFTNWTLAIGTEDDQKYMRPLFEFLLLQFVEIFGETILGAEQCIAYNDSTAPCPMLITNRTPIQLRTCSKSLRYWAQYIYQTSHELTHYVIRQYKEDKDAIVRWFEETLCEAMSLYILKSSSLRWHECALSHINSNYGTSLMDYFKSTYDETGPSSLKACRSLDDLKNVESTCQTQRISRTIERNYLVDAFCEHPESISAFVYYPLYMRGDLQIDFEKWKESDSTPLVSKLESIQPNLAS